jgi:hypothetical protein
MSISEDQGSTNNYSKTTLMEGNFVDYHELDILEAEIDPLRLNSFKGEIIDSKEWPYKSKISITHDKHTRSQYQIDSSHTKLSFSILWLTS